MTRLRRLDLGRVAILALLVVGTAALLTRDQWDWVFEDGSVRSEAPIAPTIDDLDDATERLYRIGAGSTVTYAVQERLGGSERVAEGTTTGVAGDIAVNLDDPAASRVGTIVVNVEMFESDSNLRDKRIRLDYLESRSYPLAVFETSGVDGLPATVVDGEVHELTLRGDLTVKETSAPVTFTGSVDLAADSLRATMSTTVLMSTFDVGPIDIAGLVHTGDEVELVFELVAPRVEVDSAGVDVAEFAAAPHEAPDGEFSSTVMPIVERRCVACHGENGAGQSTVGLATAGDVAEIADDIALVTSAGYMPPWPAGDLSVPFEHDWSLTDDELATIAAWAAAGGGLDVPADTPLVDAGDQLRHVEADAIGRTLPYSGSTEITNDYRCRMVEVGDPSDERWIQGIELDPDHLEVTHHALVFTAPDSSRPAVERASLGDPEEGFACFGLAGIPGSRLVHGWAPGAQPFELPTDAGLRLAPGDFVILQIHYHFTDVAPADAPSLIFDLADRAALEAAGGSLRPLDYEVYLGPAEIPCTPDEVGPLCDRDAVIEQIIDDYGRGAAGIPLGLLLQCGTRLDEFLADTDGVVTSTCDHRVTNPGEVVTLWGHMHEFGSSYRMTLNPDTPEERILLDIPTWSFEWQFGYEPVEELVLEPDDVLRIECTWDRALSHQPEPRYITWNEGTEDEMCWTSVATVRAR